MLILVRLSTSLSYVIDVLLLLLLISYYWGQIHHGIRWDVKRWTVSRSILWVALLSFSVFDTYKEPIIEIGGINGIKSVFFFWPAISFLTISLTHSESDLCPSKPPKKFIFKGSIMVHPLFFLAILPSKLPVFQAKGDYNDQVSVSNIILSAMRSIRSAIPLQQICFPISYHFIHFSSRSWSAYESLRHGGIVSVLMLHA